MTGGAKKPRAAGLRGRGKGLLLHNGHSKGVGTAIDGFVSDCDFYGGNGGGLKRATSDDESYLRVVQIRDFHERGFDIRDIRRREGDLDGGLVGAQDALQGLFGGVGKGILTTVIFGDPVFIKQGGDLTAELGDLIADGDAIGVVIIISKRRL